MSKTKLRSLPEQASSDQTKAILFDSNSFDLLGSLQKSQDKVVLLPWELKTWTWTCKLNES